MSHVEDRWYREVRESDGTTRRERTERHSKGLRWRARYLDLDGHERGRSFPTKILAERFLTEVEHAKLAGTYRDPDAGKVTLRRYAEGWAKGWHPDSVRGEKIRSHLDNHILPGLGSRTLAQLAARPSMIQQWISALPLGPGATGQVFITLSQVMAAAEDDGLIQRNPCKAGSIRLPKQPHRKVISWTVAEVASMRAELPERWRAMVDCGSGLGLRQAEIIASGPDEADFLRRRFHVRRQVKRVAGRAWFSAPKGGRERDVPLPGPVALALAAHIEAHPPVLVTLPWHEPGSKRHGQPSTFPLMFTTEAGRELQPSTFNTVAWRPARKRAGIAHEGRQDGMHALRHYYASVLLAGGVDIRALSEYLGHHDPAVTLRIYAHLMPSAEARALRAVESAFSAQDHGPEAAQRAGDAP